MRSLLALTACVLALAGCGGSGGPPIDRTVADKLANQADAIAAASDACTALTHARILQRQTIAAINSGRIPPAYLEPLQAQVNEIAAALELRCLPTPAAASTERAAPSPSTSSSGGKGKDDKKEKKHDGDEDEADD